MRWWMCEPVFNLLLDRFSETDLDKFMPKGQTWESISILFYFDWTVWSVYNHRCDHIAHLDSWISLVILRSMPGRPPIRGSTAAAAQVDNAPCSLQASCLDWQSRHRGQWYLWPTRLSINIHPNHANVVQEISLDFRLVTITNLKIK